MKRKYTQKNPAKRGQETVTKKIRTGDHVVAIAGNYKGVSGKVLAISGTKVTVQGVNVRKKHTRPSQLNPNASVIEIEKPIDVSNVAPCLEDGTRIKLKTKVLESGERQLVYKSEGNEVVYRTLKKAKN